MTWLRGDAPSRRTNGPGCGVTAAGEAGVRLEGHWSPQPPLPPLSERSERDVCVGQDLYYDCCRIVGARQRSCAIVKETGLSSTGPKIGRSGPLSWFPARGGRAALTRALLGGGRLNAPPSAFSRIAKKRRRAAPPGFHPPYPPSFPQLL